MRALIDATLLELAAENRSATPAPSASSTPLAEAGQGKGFLPDNHEHKLLPGMGRFGICQVCGESVERGDVDE